MLQPLTKLVTFAQKPETKTVKSALGRCMGAFQDLACVAEKAAKRTSRNLVGPKDRTDIRTLGVQTWRDFCGCVRAENLAGA